MKSICSFTFLLLTLSPLSSPTTLPACTQIGQYQEGAQQPIISSATNSENASLNLMLEDILKVIIQMLDRFTSITLVCNSPILLVFDVLELLEASFDIVQDASSVNQPFLEAEAVLVLCRVIKVLAPMEGKSFNLPPIALRSPLWFLVSALVICYAA